MPEIETSLSAEYQPAWGVKHAVREIISNALDGETRGASDFTPTGQMEVTYYPRTERLLVTNAGTKVPASALLMGKSDSRSYSGCIGTFGEGLPMALLVLSRLCYKVTIINDDEKWEPSIRHSDQYGERVLAIKTRKLRKARGLFSVDVEGITPTDWEGYRRMFLQLHPDYDEKETGYSVLRGERVLFDPAFRGHIFNRGVLVTKRDDLALGYDFGATLNRDRDFMEGYNIQLYAGRLLKALFDDGTEEQQDLYFEYLVEHEKSFEISTAYGALSDCENFQAAAKRWWVSSGNEEGDRLPVAPDSDVDSLKRYGFDLVVVPAAVSEALSTALGGSEDLIDAKRREVTEVHPAAALTDEERSNLRRAMAASVPFRPKDLAGRLRVVTFRSSSVRGHYRKEGDQHVYEVSRDALTDDYSATSALATAVSAAQLTQRGASIGSAGLSHNRMAAVLRGLLANID